MSRLAWLLTPIFLLVFIFQAVATPKADSLLKVLAQHKEQDLQKVDLLVELADLYYDTNPDTIAVIADDIVGIAQKLNSDEAMVNGLELKGISEFLHDNYDSAIYYHKEALELCRGIEFASSMASIYNNLGNVYLRMGDLQAAMRYFDSTIDLAEEHEFTMQYAKATSNKATVYYKTGNYAKALTFYLKGLDAHKKLNNISDIESALLNLSNLYFRLKDYDKAIHYADEALIITKQTNSPWSEISVLTTYAMIYNDRKQYDSSLSKLDEALEIAEDIKNTYLINIMKSNIAEASFNKGQLDKAYTLYSESIDVSKSLGDIEGVLVAKAGVGKVYVEKNNPRQAIPYLEDAFALSTKNDIKEQAQEIASYLSKAYENSGNYKQALKFNKIAVAYADSISLSKSRQEVEQLQFNHTLEQKNAEIALLEKDQDLQQSELKLNRIFLIACIIGLALSLIALYSFFINLRNVKKSNALISEQRDELHKQKEELSKQKDELAAQAEKLEELNRFKDTTFSVLSHDLRSPVNALTGTMAMLDQGVMTPEEFLVFKDELNNKLQSVSLMLDNLLQWGQIQMKGEQPLEKELLDVHEIVGKSMGVLNDPANQKQVTLNNEVPKSTSAFGDPDMFEIVVRNLLSNAVKFTPAGGSVTVTVEKDTKEIKLNVTDTGIGMPPEKAKRLFKSSINESTAGTSGEKGTGIGLQLTHSFVQKHGGDIVINSKEGEGTTFTVILPNTFM